ncbi:MAG: ABC transporter substrate-binding protein [Albidovulum sp.]|nr:ABC transporter substrate-binding protein [Albidovulum sp.]
MKNTNEFIMRQKMKLANGSLSRRDFISSAVAAGVSLPAAAGFAQGALAATPKRGGYFRMAMGHGQTTDSLDPATYENGFMTNTGYLYGNTLTEVAPDGQLVGDLAESYETSDAKTWVFTLRNGMEFHNGKTVTPEDVIASLNHHRGEDSMSAAKGNLEKVTDIVADGNSIIFELEDANADFPYIVSDYHFQIIASENGEIDPFSGIGSGPYVIDSFEPGVRVRGHRNPNYYKSDRAYFDEVEILAIVDVTARQNALLNGSVNAIDRADPKTVALLARAPSIVILETTGTLHYTMPMRVDTPPFDNYDLRMALKLAVKRQELVDKILLGHGALGNDHPISTANRFHAGNIAQREFDPEMAAAHYKKSGHSGTIQLSTSDAAFPGAVDAAQLIAASAAEVGIDIEVVREPTDGYWSNVWNKKPWVTCYWGGRPTEDWMFSSAYVEGTEWNDTAWRDSPAAKRFNEVVILARAEIDEEKRRALYEEAQRLIHDDGGALIPMFANYIMGLSTEVAHPEEVAANWEMDGAKACERWWFA